ncbi:MAG: hypothetical protein WBS17_17965, partial [Candidatus Acidiferrales bacterium]
MQLLSVQVQPVPAIESSDKPAGKKSHTNTCPLVAAAPAALDTVTVYVAPDCPNVKLPVCVIVMPSVGAVVGGAAVANVAVTVSAPAGIVNVQVAPDGVHAVGVALQPPNAPPAGGVSVKITCLAYT